MRGLLPTQRVREKPENSGSHAERLDKNDKRQEIHKERLKNPDALSRSALSTNLKVQSLVIDFDYVTSALSVL